MKGNGESITIRELHKPGQCIKAQVKATLIALDGRRFVGTNGVMNPQTRCPRAHMPHFTGYQACKAVCGQPHHAEVSAIHLAGDHALGSTIYLEGHFAACPDCQAAANAAGVALIVVGPPPSCRSQ